MNLVIARAEAFARRAHAGHMRKGAFELPYTVHLEEVVDFVNRHGGDEISIAAAWLHDVVEDVGVTFEELERQFGVNVAAVVRELTDDKALPKVERKRLQAETAPKKSARAALIKLADKTSNVRALTLTPPGWPVERMADYVTWARKVVGALPVRHLLRLLAPSSTRPARFIVWTEPAGGEDRLP